MPETWREERRERAASAALGDKPKGEPAALSRRGVVNAKMTADNKVELSLEDFRELVGAKATASEDLAAQLAKFAPKVAVALATADKPPRKVRRAEQRLAAADAALDRQRGEFDTALHQLSADELLSCTVGDTRQQELLPVADVRQQELLALGR